jgi:hypothetical protein
VHNIVATAQIQTSMPALDLDAIHNVLPCSFYDRDRFAAITIRLSSPECTTLLFSSGKLVVTGCKHWYESVYASLFMTRLLADCVRYACPGAGRAALPVMLEWCFAARCLWLPVACACIAATRRARVAGRRLLGGRRPFLGLRMLRHAVDTLALGEWRCAAVEQNGDT